VTEKFLFSSANVFISNCSGVYNAMEKVHGSSAREVYSNRNMMKAETAYVAQA
jgi:hypothetical protein